MKITAKLLLLLMALAVALALGCSSDDPAAPPDDDFDPPPAGTTLIGDDGQPTDGFDSYEQVSLGIEDLDPNTQYTVEVDDPQGTLLGRYDLWTDDQGQLDTASIIYDPTPGVYTVRVLGTDIEFGLRISAPENVYYLCTDDAGDHVNNYTVGDVVYLRAGNGTAGAAVHVYVVPNRYDWEYGMYLYDYTESVEELTFDGSGNLPNTAIWQSAAQADETAAFDVVIDVNRNSIYDAGDYLDGRAGVGFVVQEVLPAKTLIDGHVVERLSSDVHYVYRDLFDADEDVYVYINPVAKMRNLGADRSVKWFIVPHQATWNDQDPLNPVVTPLGDTVQEGCTNIGRRKLWNEPLTPGQYDIVIDIDKDDLYDKGQDILDGYSGPGDWVGFTVQAEPETKDWAILVYADGEGGLSGTRSQYATEIANAMDADTYAGVLFDGDDGAGYTDCKRYICTPGTVTMDADYGELNMGHPLTLHDFLTWGIAKFPADRYMVVLSNHGGSWYGESHAVPNELWYEGDKAICYDGGDGLNMYELEAVFRDIKTLVGGKLDVVWYQGCLMGAIEVASVSKDYFAYMVSHETVRYGSENANKFPNLIAEMNSDPTAQTAAEKAVTVQTSPNSSYCASYDLSEYDDVETAIRTFVNTALNHDDWELFRGDLEDLLDDVRRVAPPGTVGSLAPYEQNGDLQHFFELVSEAIESNIPEEVRDAAGTVETTAIFLVDEAMGNNGGAEGLYGVAIWLPPTATEFNNYAVEYSGFDFATETRWSEFLAALYGVAYRIELTWGAVPTDLDAQLYDAQEPHAHLYWPYSGDGNSPIPDTSLDLDDVTSYGPENIRIGQLHPGPGVYYEYWVDNFSEVTTNEAATVKVFVGGNPTPVKTYYHTFGAEDVWGWHVFDIHATTGVIVDVNDFAGNVPYKKSGETK